MSTEPLNPKKQNSVFFFGLGNYFKGKEGNKTSLKINCNSLIWKLRQTIKASSISPSYSSSSLLWTSAQQITKTHYDQEKTTIAIMFRRSFWCRAGNQFFCSFFFLVLFVLLLQDTYPHMEHCSASKHFPSQNIFPLLPSSFNKSFYMSPIH